MVRRGFQGCVICHGTSGCKRKMPGGSTCTKRSCQDEYTLQRKQAKLPVQTQPATELDMDNVEDMPEYMYVVDLQEILGERCCRPSQLSNPERRGGPRQKSKYQEFLVRGSFLENQPEDGDDDEDDDDWEPPPFDSTFWVSSADLYENIDYADVRQAIVERQKKVLLQSTTQPRLHLRLRAGAAGAESAPPSGSPALLRVS